MKALLFVLILLGAGAALYFYQAHDLAVTNREKLRLSCLDAHYQLPAGSKLVSDVEGFCECQSHIDLTAAPDTIKTQGRTCSDQFSKDVILARCEDFKIRAASSGDRFKDVRCDCFYDRLMTLSMDAMMMRDGIQDLPPETAQTVSQQAIAACLN